MGEQITYHKLLESTRLDKGVSIKNLAYGLCAESTMYSFVKGERLPNYQLGNRFMERLGVSSVGFEDFVSDSEYLRWIKESELISKVEEKNLSEATALLKELKLSKDLYNRVDRQVLLDMEAKILEQQGAPFNRIAALYKKAVDFSMPELSMSCLNNNILSSYEYYLILRFLKFDYTSKCWVDNQVEAYKNIMQSILNSELDVTEKSKVYSMAVCGYYSVLKDVLKEYRSIAEDILERCMTAEKLLKSCFRMYFLIDILRIKLDVSCPTKTHIKDDISHTIKLLKILEHMYKEFGLDPSMEYKGFIYEGAAVCSINEFIYRRRRLIGMSRKELAEGICDVRTLMRIENHQVSPQRSIIHKLLEKMGVSGNYRRINIQIDNYAIPQLNKDSAMLSDLRRDNESNEESQKHIINALKSCRPCPLHENYYNIAWNRARMRQDYFSSEMKNSLEICREISYCCDDDKKLEFYDSCIEKWANKIDWTY